MNIINKSCSLLLIVLIFLASGCSSGTDSRGYPKKDKFDNFYGQYSDIHKNIDNFYTNVNTKYNLVKTQQITVIEFKSHFSALEKDLGTNIAALDAITTPNGVNSQYSIGYLKFSAECGIDALRDFKNMSVISFEDNLRKGIDAKNTSMQYVQSIKQEVR